MEFQSFVQITLGEKMDFMNPHHGYATEVNPSKQHEFYTALWNSLPEDNYILEGSAIDPGDRNQFKYDAVVLLARIGLSPEKKLKYSRAFDSDWTCRRENNYLLDLFKDYKQFEEDWVNKNPEIVVNTTDLFKGLGDAEEFITRQLEAR